MAAGSESARQALRATIRQPKVVALNLASQEIGDAGTVEIARALADPPNDAKDPVRPLRSELVRAVFFLSTPHSPRARSSVILLAYLKTNYSLCVPFTVQ